MLNRRNIGLALGMAAAVALTADALIASTVKQASGRSAEPVQTIEIRED